MTRDGVPGLSYISQEAAYEVAVEEAAGDLRIGNEIRIEVVGGSLRSSRGRNAPIRRGEAGGKLVPQKTSLPYKQQR